MSLQAKSSFGPAGADEVNSTMASLELPELEGFECSTKGAGALHEKLRKDFGVELPAMFWEGRLWVRISSQVFNIEEDYRALRDAIQQMRRA